jgi:ATP-binding cassette, subfamily B (MDR/TAP), member 1
VQEALEVASQSRTTVSIAHRLSTIMNADNIIVMSHGTIIEQGTHDDLYARDGMYRGLVDAQRISAEGNGDGYRTPEEFFEAENHIRRVTSNLDEEKYSPLRKMTGQSTISFNENNSGIVAQTRYSLFYLFKKVRTCGTK